MFDKDTSEYHGFQLQVMEGLPSGTVVGTVTAKDPDEGENGTVHYSLSGECFSATPKKSGSGQSSNEQGQEMN